MGGPRRYKINSKSLIIIESLSLTSKNINYFSKPHTTSIMTSLKPRVILGLMTYGPPEASADNRVTTIEEFKQHLDAFQSHGYNELDTARIYSVYKQEAFTAQAGWKERGFKIATKSMPLVKGDHSAANLRKDLETSLSELGTDCVDIFYLHSADRTTPFTETLEAANELYKEGKFKQLGVSNFTAYEVAEIVMLCQHRGWVKPTIYQGVYNAISKDPPPFNLLEPGNQLEANIPLSSSQS